MVLLIQLELDRVLIDAYRTGNRHGFNVGAAELRELPCYISVAVGDDLTHPLSSFIDIVSEARVRLCKLDTTNLFRPLEVFSFLSEIIVNHKFLYLILILSIYCSSYCAS